MNHNPPIVAPPVFPTHSLPPRIYAAVHQSMCATKAPVALIVSTALSAASLAVQSKFDIRRRKNLKSPCSLYVLTFAESGERKTTIDELFFRFFRQFEADCKAKKKVDSTDQDQDKDLASGRQKPIRLLYSDTTTAAFLKGMSEHGNSAGLIEDEAGRVFKGRMIEDLGLLNKLWGGQSICVDRRSDSFVVESPRATINWMVQPSTFTEYMERKGDGIRGIGFLARCLVSYPLSTQGWRFIDFEDIELAAVEAFGERVLELLRDQHDFIHKPKDHERIELSFSPNAQYEWTYIFNTIESALQPGGTFCQNRDYASKVAEIIARLAGVLHAFEGYEGTLISLETLRSASAIVMWYANEFVRLFTPPGPMDLLMRNVTILDNWLIQWARQGGLQNIRKNDLLQLAPKALRQRTVMDMCLSTLRMWGRLDFSQSLVPNPTSMTSTPKRATQFVSLGPYYYQVHS